MANGAFRTARRPRPNGSKSRSSDGRSNRSTPSTGSEYRPPSLPESKRSYEQSMSLAQAAAVTGDVIETEMHYQRAEHFLRLMRENSNAAP